MNGLTWRQQTYVRNAGSRVWNLELGFDIDLRGGAYEFDNIILAKKFY